MSITYTFKEYVLSWWESYLEKTTEENARSIMENEFIGDEEGVDDYIPEEAEDCRDWLLRQDDAEKIYRVFFGCDGTDIYDDTPSTETFLNDMFTDTAIAYRPNGSMSFEEVFIDDMVHHASEYETPEGFFKDLAQGGCISGMIGMLIYNSDCKKIYIEHIDDLEVYKESLEDEMGEPICNRHHVPHYTFVLWLCYEEYAYNLGRVLYPEVF